MVSTASVEQRASGSFSVVIRRGFYWLLVTIFVGSAVCLEVVASRSRSNPVEHAFLFVSVAQVAFALLALWSMVFVRREPVLVRIALFLMVVVSYSILWVHRL